MKIRNIRTCLCVALAVGLSACGDDKNSAPRVDGGAAACATPAGAGEMFALTASNKLISFDLAVPGTTVTSADISGLAGGDTPVGLDYRPHDRRLYLLTNNNGVGKLYCVGPDGGAKHVVSLETDAPLDGTHFAMDFNPQRDRLRVIGVGGLTLQNLSVNPSTGQVAEDIELTGNPTPRVAAVAYTNTISKVSSTVLTTALYGIDSAANQVVRIGAEPATDADCATPEGAGNPKCGVVDDAGTVAFTSTVDVDDNVSFDIDGGTGLGYAAMNAAGATSSTLYSVDLDDGAIAAIGAIGGGETIKGLTLATQYEANVYGVTETNKLISFRPGNPHAATTPDSITGLPAGVNVLGADFRALDGGLFALASNGRLYTINTLTAAASLVGFTSTPPVLTGSAFGVDFNSNSDRLRVISDTEENIRFNPTTGLANTPDANVSPAGEIAAIAIDRNFVGSSGVTKYGIDTASNNLVTIGEGSANTGRVTNPLSLGVNPASTCAGFDIAGGRNGIVLAALDIGGASVLHTINLATGAATAVTNTSTTTGIIAVGERVCSLAIEIKQVTE